MANVGEECVCLLESVGKGADEEAFNRALQAAHDLQLRRCQPAQRAVACVWVGTWLSSKAMATMGECPCWERPSLPTLSLIFYLVSQSFTFFLRAKVEAARANGRCHELDDPEVGMRRLLTWALLESRLFRMPALHVHFLRCICDCFARIPNVNMYKSEIGAETNLMLAELIFKGQADISIDAETETSNVKFADWSSNIEGMDPDMKFSVCVDVADVNGSSETEGVDGKRAASVNVTSGVVDVDPSSKSKGVNASSHVKDVDVQGGEDKDIKRASCVHSFPKNLPDRHAGEMKRESELAQCFCILEVAKELVPSDARLLKWKISLLRAQVKLSALSLCPKLYIHQKVKLPVVGVSSGEQDEGASYVFSSKLKKQLAPLLKGNIWLYFMHIGITMSLLFHNNAVIWKAS